MSKIMVLYHRSDYDGIFCREIAKKFLPDATLIGWDFADTPVDFPTEGIVYVLDLPPEQPFGRELAFEEKERVIWIDHHASSLAQTINRMTGYKFKGYRIDGVAACRLAWQYLKEKDPQWITHLDGFPTKEDFIERRVTEPVAVRLAGGYDIWDKRDPNAELFQHGLRSKELTDHDWSEMLSIKTSTPPIVRQLLENGKVLQHAITKP